MFVEGDMGIAILLKSIWLKKPELAWDERTQ
jgi:hypothetical protein